MSGTVTQIMKILIFFILVILLLSVIGLIVSWWQAVSYREYAVDELKRYGGVTTEAIASLEEYSENNYGGRYKVVSRDGNDKKPWGETILFTVEGQSVGDLYFPPALIKVNGVSVSQVR